MRPCARRLSTSYGANRIELSPSGATASGRRVCGAMFFEKAAAPFSFFRSKFCA